MAAILTDMLATRRFELLVKSLQ